ncbi:nucleoside hydrolase [Lentilactobacillus kosonis]|uniref:Inosine-uridine preferring nucleoside hydrolase n=1 Tax=Lentilactobacillus kosonis TaxID=2810561 RepID=A0A401FIF1_9LACO|nr:nucleoside hydrolase [Lentilactobacillus kosonis]GAY72134.1 inosine-uridine preferring nucleoside hydrolase [Lentilactobacillus kosonis]
MAQKKMILDLDTGIDDAMAIAYAVASPEVDLIGIIGSYGNVYVEDGAINSLKILELLGVTDVPVYVGLSHSSESDHFDRMPISAQIHGENGIGEVELPEPTRPVETGDAIDFLIDSVKQYGKDLILVPTGPLTNLDAAIKKDPSITKEIGNVTIMGGALTVPGNVTNVTEANIQQDAAAANRVFISPLHLTMVGLDVTLRTLLTKKETQQWRDLGTKSGEAFADIVDYYIKAYEVTSPDLHGCALHDPFAVGVAINPDFVQCLDLNMYVTTDDKYYGRTIGDPARLSEPETNVKVAVNANVDAYLKEFMSRLGGLFKQN